MPTPTTNIGWVVTRLSPGNTEGNVLIWYRVGKGIGVICKSLKTVECEKVDKGKVGK